MWTYREGTERWGVKVREVVEEYNKKSCEKEVEAPVWGFTPAWHK